MTIGGCAGSSAAHEPASPDHEHAGHEPEVKTPPETSTEGEKTDADTEPPPPPPLVACRGQMTEALAGALGERAAQARTCYEKLLRTSPKAEGRLLVELRITESGDIAASSIVEDELNEPELATCVLANLTATAVPAPADGCATVRVPLRFVPKKPAPQP